MRITTISAYAALSSLPIAINLLHAACFILDKIVAKTRRIAKPLFRDHCPLHAHRRFNQKHL